MKLNRIQIVKLCLSQAVFCTTLCVADVIALPSLVLFVTQRTPILPFKRLEAIVFFLP